jgi:hypothetical protein
MTFIQIIGVKTQSFQAIRKAADEYRRATQGNGTTRREMLAATATIPAAISTSCSSTPRKSATKNSTLPETRPAPSSSKP